MALVAQTLLVGLVVSASVSERDDVVALRCRDHAARLLALDAQRVAREQRGTHGLQSPAGDPLHGDDAHPGFARMISTAATTVAHQFAAPFVGAWTWGVNWHRRPPWFRA